MDSSPIVSPPITFKQKVAKLVTRHKNLILIALILVISLFDIGLFLSKQGININPISSKTVPSKITEKNMLATTQSTLCPGGGTRQCIYDDAGKQECYDYCYNGTTIDVQNPPPTLPPQDTNKVIQDAVNNTSNLCAQQDNSCTLQGCTPTSKGNSCGACDCTRRITPTDLRPLLTPTATPQPTAVPVPPTSTSAPVAQKPTAAPPTSTPTPSTVVCDSLNNAITCNGFGLSCYWDAGTCHKKASPLTPSPANTQVPTNCSALGSEIACNGFGLSCSWTGKVCTTKSSITPPTSTPTKAPLPNTNCGSLSTSAACNGFALSCSWTGTACVSKTSPSEILPVNTASAPEPSETRATIAVYTQGLGTNTGLGQNSNPIRAQDLQIQILDSQNNILKEGLISLLAKQVSGQLPTNVGFEQLISLGKDLPAGNYQTRVKLDNTLWKTINANLTPGSQTTLPPLELVLGDVDQDNQISLVDYNMLISCFGQNICTQKVQADLNLDGKIDETDLNLLYNSFKTRLGQ